MKKRMMWILELFLWGLVIFSALFVSLYLYNINVRKHNTYYVFFKDVDGLIKGSPVKFQGYQIGYVSNLSVVNEEVFVTFIITEKNFHAPKEITATVEFTGLGASKSLELSGDDFPEGKHIIQAVEPRRIKDFYDDTDAIAQNIIFLANDFTKVFTDKTIPEMKSFIKYPTLLKDVEEILDTINKNVEELNRKMSKNDK